MKAPSMRPGIALPLTMALLLSATIILAGIVSYVSGGTRQTAAYVGKSACRLAAVSALERARDAIYIKYKGKTGNKALLFQSGSLDWFKTWNRHWIGKTDPLDFDDVAKDLAKDFPGIGVRIRLQSSPWISGTYAHLVLFATASNLTGTASSTICEELTYGVDRSKVFDHAYFVNNYGWFEGSTITANGDVRANGDMSLSQSPKVNGNVYAAANDELKVPGDIKNGNGNMDSRSTYKSTQYGVKDRARPLQTTPGDGGYDAPATVSNQSKNDRLHPQSEILDMPWISNLDQYIEYGKLSDPANGKQPSTLSQMKDGKLVYYVDNRDSNKGGANYGYYTGTGPSGDPKMPDNHALVLEGTDANPIILNGPVVVSNDVVIKGVVTGQGTIYSQRNIHIVGNITYKNPPNWANKAAAANNGNSTKDLLGLAAKGNIVMGDPTASSWLDSTLKNCLSTQPYVQQYICAKNDDGTWGDGDIGYPKAGQTKFGGSYIVADGGSKVAETKTEQFHYVTSTDRWGRKTQTKVSDGYAYTYSKNTQRKYYDSVVAPHEISSRASTITQIDAVLYNNHGIFGHIGACTINGSLVCRNEGMIFSGSLYLNWDYRLYSGSPESVANSLVGMPVSAAAPLTLSLQEVPDAWNKD